MKRLVLGAIGQTDFEARVLSIAEAACHSDRTILMLHGPGRDPANAGAEGVIHAPYMSSAMAAEYHAHWAHLNPYPDLVRAFPDGIAFTTEEVMSIREYRKLPYHGWAERTFGTHELGGVVAREGENTIAVGVGRSQRLGPFRKSQRDAMQGLMNHLRSAWFLHRCLSHADRVDDAGARALVQLALENHACLAIDGNGRALNWNALADSLLCAGGPFGLERGHVTFTSPATNMRFHAILAGEASEGPFSLGGEHQAQASATLVRVRAGSSRSGSRSEWLLFIPVRDGLRTMLRVEAFAERFSLSRRERSILGHLVGGRSIGEMATAMSLPVASCRHSVKQILRKSGLSRQAEVVARVLE